MAANGGNDEQKRSLDDGTVTAIVAQKRDPSRVSIFIDGEFAFGITSDTLVVVGLTKGKFLTSAEQAQILEKDRGPAARAAAMAYLARRARTREEVRRKLRDSGFGEAVTEAAISRLEELGYVDDRDYAWRFAAARLARRYGPRRILQDLRRRGISDRIAEEALRTEEESQDPFAAVRDLAEERFARLQRENDVRKRKKKVFDFLVRRGYGTDLAWRAIDALDVDALMDEGESSPDRD